MLKKAKAVYFTVLVAMLAFSNNALVAQAAGSGSGHIPTSLALSVVDTLPVPDVVAVLIYRKMSDSYLLVMRRTDANARYVTRAMQRIQHGFEFSGGGSEARIIFRSRARAPLTSREQALQEQIVRKLAERHNRVRSPGYGIEQRISLRL
jgi:hypothetical protein